MYGVLWALCTIFANSFSDKFPYWRCTGMAATRSTFCHLHGYYVVPLSYFHHRPAVDPGGMCETARLVMVILMIGTVAAAYGADRPHFGSPRGTSDGTFREPSNIVQVTMTCIFACMMQYTVPIIADGCRSKTGLSSL
jgi:hypothetical protein